MRDARGHHHTLRLLGMLGTGSGGGFDQTFFVLQGVAIVSALIALLAGRALGTWALWLAGEALVLSLGSIAYWYIAHPPQNGIDGAGRLLFGVPAVLINLVLAGIVIWRQTRR